MKEAMERYGVSSGSLNSALTYGYSAGGYHFYRADEPKPDDSFFKSGKGGKGSSKKRPVICLETGVQFESAIAALKWLDSGKTNNRGNMRTALISGSALLGYHFYYADEPKPPNSHFKRAVYCEDLDTVFTSLETCADAIGFNGSISDLADEDFALLCWDSVNHLPAIRRISLKASLTSRLIDFKYLREAEAPAYTHGVSNDTFDYEFDDDDDDIPAFSFPEA